MATNPNIALSYQPNVAMQRRDPLADAANIQALQANQTKMDDLREFKEFSTRLAAAGKDPDPLALAREMKASGRPEMVMKALELETQIKALGLEDQAYKALIGGGAAAPAMPQAAPAAAPGSFAADVATRRAAMPANALAPAPAAPTNALTPAMEPQAQEINRLMWIATQFPTTKAGMQAMKSAELLRQMNKPYVVGNRLVTGTGQELYAAPDKPAAPPGMVAEYTFAKTPEGGNFQGTYQQFVTARAAAGRAPAQPVAPTITQIVDPRNPNQMITIDARRYTGGSVGSPGVLGVGGKEPGAAVRANKSEEGKTQLADDLDNLRASFTKLDEMRAIPSTARNPLSNIASATAATGIGQTAGRFVGTEAQVEREVINSARTRLVNSIKNATGMSAQQLNSNVELQTMLKSISDPGQPIEAALRIIDDIENAYVKGAGMPKKKSPAAGGKSSIAPPPGFTAD
jgi:hypothetical protein